MSWDGSPFSGAKLAAVHGDRLLVYRRDRFDHIPFPGLLDLPGGGREGAESPAECALRELAEEFGIVVPSARISYARGYAGSWNAALASHFLAVELAASEIAAIRFGDEGTDWRLMPITGFLGADDAVPHLKDRLADFVAAGMRYPDTASRNPGKA